MEQNFKGISLPIAVKNSPVDAALAPLETYNDIGSIGEDYRYDGLTVTVKKTDDGKKLPIEYFLYQGTSNNYWKIKKLPPLNTYADMASLPQSYKLYLIGTEVVIKKDENNGNKPSKYWVTAVSTAGVTWERCNMAVDSNGVTISGNDMEESEAVPAE